MRLKIDIHDYKNAYLNLEEEDLEGYENPLIKLDEWERENFHLHVIRLMRNPKYFHWTCKVLLDVDLLPYQVVVLQELWNKTMPLYISSRGGGKLEIPSNKLRTQHGWTTMEDIKVGDKVYARDGRLYNVISKTPLQTDVDIYRITLRDGRSIEVCGDHHWLVWDKNKNRNKKDVWTVVQTKDMVDKFCIKRKGEKSNGTEMRYALPVNSALLDEEEKDLPIDPYVLGVLLGDGYFGECPTIESADPEIIENVQARIDYKVTCTVNNNKKSNTYRITGKDRHQKYMKEYAKELGLYKTNSHTKFIPEIYKYGSYQQRLELLQGLMDTDGYSYKHTVEYTTMSEQLANDIVDLARSLGIHTKLSTGTAMLNGKSYGTKYRIYMYTKLPIFTLPRKLEFIKHEISKQEQSKYSKVYITNIEYVGKGKGYCIQVDSPDHTYLTKDYIVTHNSFLLGIYSMLRCLLVPESKIVIVGAAFRQAKVIFEYMETLWKNAPIFRSLCSDQSGPRRDIDRCIMKINDSVATAIPLGTGDKIRGLRAHTIIADEFNCVSGDTIVETNQGLMRIGEMQDVRSIKVFTGDESHKYEIPDKYIITPPSEVYQISFDDGSIIKCSENHLLYTKKDGWKKTTELCQGDLVEAKNIYEFPQRTLVNKRLAWLFGILLARGHIYSDKIMIRKDAGLIRDKLVRDFDFKELNGYILCENKNLVNCCHKLGLSDNTKVPWSILMSNRESVDIFVRAFMSGSRYSFNGKQIIYRFESEAICRDIQLLLRKLGYFTIYKDSSLQFDQSEYKAFVHKEPGNIPDYRTITSIFSLPKKEILYDYYLPKTHSFYAGGVRNHNSIPVQIFETVVAGFIAVSKDPVDNVKMAAMRKKMMKDGVWTDFQEQAYQERHQNQCVLSGTAGYDFEPFATYWKSYRDIILSGGDLSKIFKTNMDNDKEEDDNDSSSPGYLEHLNWRDLSIIRIPYELIPEGMMSDAQVARSRATMHVGTYMMEYAACFCKDSTGFFKRTLIESCVAKERNVKKDNWPDWCPTTFSATNRGNPNRKYVFGIDPASEIDNFALVILELHNEHQRVVYAWTTNRKDFQARKRLGLTDAEDYYSFCVRKIRDLMAVFPCVAIGIDSQGGGYQIAEGLRDKDKMKPDLGEQPILEIIEEGKKKETDRLPGLHILQFINFASAEWTSNANHGLRKDMEDKVLLFPEFDQLTLSLVTAEDERQFRELKKKVKDSRDLKLYDTLEDVVLDIEELKNELATIMVTRTPSGREKFDTPEIKLGSGKKGRMRKDRYSALVIANMIARSIHREIPAPIYQVVADVAGSNVADVDSDKLFVGSKLAEQYTLDAIQVVRHD